ncbi:MAG: hypothetical protein ABFE08_18965 [Armatimonadia bacterium]
MTAWNTDMPYGYSITYANGENPCWLVMRWGEIKRVCSGLEEAVEWLQEELDLEHEQGDTVPGEI